MLSNPKPTGKESEKKKMYVCITGHFAVTGNYTVINYISIKKIL